jgi:uncharacterized membrane protein
MPQAAPTPAHTALTTRDRSSGFTRTAAASNTASSQSINAEGQVVGFHFEAGGPEQGFLYNHGTYTTIEPTANVTGVGVNVIGINNQGQIIGSFQTMSGGYTVEESFLCSHGTYTILAFPGAINTQTDSINASGQVVGWYEVGPNGVTAQYGFIYSNGTYTTIDPPGGLGTTASSINDLGQIVGSYTGNGTEHGFLATDPPGLLATEHFFSAQLTAIPEPSTWALLLVGFAGLVAARFLSGPAHRRRSY